MQPDFCYDCALVTGASSGLGEEFAMQLAPRVNRLVLTARRTELLETLAEKIRREFPGIVVLPVAVDLTLPEERKHLLETLASHGMVPDLLINNAGMGDYGEFSSAAWPKLEAMLRLNVEALTHLTHLLLQGMIRKGGGAVINISSLASLMPIPDFAVYAATKAYVTSFSEALRIELKDYGIPVLAVCPGPVHTGFGDVANRGEGEEKTTPSPEYFYVQKEQVVSEALYALSRNKPRLYPGLKIAAAALLISVIPIALIRVAMNFRPRKQ